MNFELHVRQRRCSNLSPMKVYEGNMNKGTRRVIPRHYQNRSGQQRIIQWTLAFNKAKTIKAATHGDSDGLWHCCHIALLSDKKCPVVPEQPGKQEDNQFKHTDELTTAASKAAQSSMSQTKPLFFDIYLTWGLTHETLKV